MFFFAHRSKVGALTRYSLGSSDRIILGTWNFTTNSASCSSANTGVIGLAGISIEGIKESVPWFVVLVSHVITVNHQVY